MRYNLSVRFMLNQQTIREVIDTELEDIKKKKIVQREEVLFLKEHLKSKKIVAVSGVRRSGKTYLLFQLIQELLRGKLSNNILYVNFEDDKFTNQVSQLDLIYKTFLEYKNPKGKIYFFLDEIQNISRWEKWLARMHEKNIKFFISGSNTSLLSSEFSKSLTGRHKLIEIFPLSFQQFVAFKNKELLNLSLSVPKVSKTKHLLESYLKLGGFPEVVYDGQPDVLKDYFKDIISRDIILRRNIKFKQSLKETAVILMTNIACLHSLYSLNKILQARSINTIKNYLSFLEESYLIFRVPFFAFSLRRQLANPFKIYAIDLGLRNKVSFNFSRDIGWLYENAAAIELIRRFGQENIFYWKNIKHQEVDFIVRRALKIDQLIQACYDFGDKNTKKREITSLLNASRELKCDDLLIITCDEEKEEKIKGKKIKFVPLWKWLLAEKS